MKFLFTIILFMGFALNINTQNISANNLENLFKTNNDDKIKNILQPIGFIKGVEEKRQGCIVEFWHYKIDKYIKICKNNCLEYQGVVTIDLFDKSVFNTLKSQFKDKGYKLVESGKKDGFNFQVYRFKTDYLTMVYDLSGGDEYYGVSLAEFPILSKKNN